MSAPDAMLAFAAFLFAAPAADAPAELLEQARAAAADGRYERADALYRRIVAEAPQSEEAQTAAKRLEPNALLRTVDLEINGPSENRVDLFILGDGYLRDRGMQKIFDQAAHQTIDAFCQAPVHKRYRKYFNFVAMNLASAEDGIDRKGAPDVDTALGGAESDATQGQVQVDHALVDRFLHEDPRAEGFAVCIVRLGSAGTGGGGVAVIGGSPSNTVIHEWGHAFAQLLDEYTSDVGYTGPVPRGINVANDPDPAKAPWRHWLDKKTKGVGMFPGAAGRSQGAWRGTATGCAMARGPSFCLICREAVVAHLYDLVSPIDGATPDPAASAASPASPASSVLRLAAGSDETLELSVVPMEVSGGPALKSTFTIERVQEAFDAAGATDAAASGDDVQPGSGATGDGATEEEWWRQFMHEGGGEGSGLSGGGYGRWERPSRFGRPADAPLAGEEVSVEKRRLADRRTAHVATLRARSLEAGNYVIRARVTDPIDWVAREDWVPLLTDEVTWRVVVE